MLSIGELITPLRGRVDPGYLLGTFTPPDRFADKSFANYHPRHPTQHDAAALLRQRADELSRAASRRVFNLLRSRSRSTDGVYLDGGFGVGKTHLLAAFWNSAPGPKAYLSFDELMYFIGTTGAAGVGRFFEDHRVIAIDEWELDDPGNLKMALAFLRSALLNDVFVAVTSNTLPLELGAGRFSQKDFKLEIDELASRFEVVRVEGDDYRHRHFAARPTDEYFAELPRFEERLSQFGPRAVRCTMRELLRAIESIHPIRYRELARQTAGIGIEEVEPILDLPAALRWVHFIDSIYDAGVALVATGSIPLGELFRDDAQEGPYGKKLSRCLSRMEELLAESVSDEDSGELAMAGV